MQNRGLTVASLLLCLLAAGCASDGSTPPRAEPVSEPVSEPSERSPEAEKERPAEADPPAAATAVDSPATGTSAEADFSWLEDLYQREIDLPPLRDVVLTDGSARLRAPSAAPIEVVLTKDGIESFDLTLGTESDIECWVYAQELDPASTLAWFSQVVLDRVESIEERSILRVGADQVEGIPYLALDWMYRFVDDAGQRLIGVSKQMIGATDQRSILCLHDEVGYVKTLDEAFRAIVSSFETGDEAGSGDDDAPAPTRTEISVAELSGLRVGFLKTTHEIDAEGDYAITEQSAMLLPVDRQSLQTSDSLGIEWSTPEGLLINAYGIENEGAETTMDLELERAAEDRDADPEAEARWTVSGTFQGKPLDATITGSLDSSLAMTHLIRELIERGEIGASGSLRNWDGALDPTSASPVEVSLLELHDDGGATVEIAMESLTLTATADRQGWISDLRTRLAGTEMVFQRIYVDE